MVERSLTLMAVHAHPDDEATSTGGVLARYAAEGITTVVVTCTDGRCGDGPGGVKPGEAGHDPEAVVTMRQAELTASCKALEVTHLETLGYHDSGMMGWATNDLPGAFWNTPVEEAAERLAGLIRKYRPDVVVTYDENGFYGHPDHIQAHRITMAAVAKTDVPAKVYWTTVPRSAFQEFGRVMKEIGVEFPEPDEGAPEMPELGLPDEEISTWVDTSGYGAQKFESLARSTNGRVGV
ncbi:PIG-L family deacetylase [Micromonospora zhanjiangensis]